MISGDVVLEGIEAALAAFFAYMVVIILGIEEPHWIVTLVSSFSVIIRAMLPL